MPNDAQKPEVSEEIKRKIIDYCKRNQDTNWARIGMMFGVDPKTAASIYMESLF